MMSMDTHTSLSWQMDMGVDVTIGDVPVNRLKQTDTKQKTPTSAQTTKNKTAQKSNNSQISGDQPSLLTDQKPMGQQDALIRAKELAESADDLDSLHQIIQDFDGLSIKQMAMNCVFADGPDSLDVVKAMIIGEAPGADEDRQGKPFVGKSGQLLDKMLAAIGLDRTKNAYITNVLNWRPPGNRTPTDGEVALSRPFINRHIELVNPPAILLIGGIATKTFVDHYSSLGRLRGQDITITPDNDDNDGQNHPARATYHPAYLLRRPGHKRRTWDDLLQFKIKYLTN